jgi:hypothetical protein
MSQETSRERSNKRARKNRRTAGSGVFYAVLSDVIKSSLKAPRAVREENTVVSPVGFGTKNNCAGDDQQQFSNQSVMLE